MIFDNFEVLVDNNIRVYNLEEFFSGFELVNPRLIQSGLKYHSVSINQNINGVKDFVMVTVYDDSGELYYTNILDIPVQELYKLFNYFVDLNSTVKILF